MNAAWFRELLDRSPDVLTKIARSVGGKEAPGWIFVVAGVLSVLGLRVSVPGLPIPFAAGVLGVFFCLLIVWRWPVNRLGLYMLAGLVAIGLIGLGVSKGNASWTSLALLCFTYIPVMLLPATSNTGRGGGELFFLGALGGIKVAAVLGIVQVVAQLGFGLFLDPLGALPGFLTTPGFNSVYPTTWVTSAFGLSFKPNGMLLQEPSSLSFYCALGVVWILWRLTQPTHTRVAGRVGDWIWLTVLASALVLSISTSGIPILLAGLLALVPRLLRSWRLFAIVGGCVAVAAALGLLQPMVVKATEGFTGATSTNQRLVAPYQLLLPYFGESPIVGHGPGSASRLLRGLGDAGIGVQSPTLLKAAIEYGFLGLLLILGMLALAVLSLRGAPIALVFAAVMAWLLFDALLNTSTVALLFLALPHWRNRQGSPRPSSLDEGRTNSVRGFSKT